jgi:hypothetical protein
MTLLYSLTSRAALLLAVAADRWSSPQHLDEEDGSGDADVQFLIHHRNILLVVTGSGSGVIGVWAVFASDFGRLEQRYASRKEIPDQMSRFSPGSHTRRRRS